MVSFDTVLFDLDGTLLPVDIEKFLEKYFNILSRSFVDLAEADEFENILYKATEQMIKNDGQKTNKDVFVEQFFSLINVKDEDRIMDRFNKFYQEKYSQLQDGIEKNEKVVKLVELFKKNNYQMVVATNPLFPIDAIEKRIKWAGLNVNDFKYITSYENMHYAKPNLNYFKEVLEKVSKSAEDCIMVGNDVQEDMVAGKLGLKTYLVEDFKRDRNTGNIRPDWSGTMAELHNYFKKELQGN